ncbi:SPFH domain / Band 7 family protein [Phycisphaerae bacterium RAS1]|nr:SPFH domain / Band 7 family protein [Phycisphaerae bacterium RAS1]
MALITPPSGDADRYRKAAFAAAGRLPLGMMIGVVTLALAVLASGYVWFVQRVEVEAGQLLVLVRKVGSPLPAAAEGQVLLYPELLKSLGEPADSTAYQGIVFEPRTEGRYFYDPFFWRRMVVPAQIVSQDEVGVLVRKYGKPLPPGRLVAVNEDERGPLPDVLKPARYNVNPFAYAIQRIKPVIVPAGAVGVQTLLHGRDSANPNDYLVAEGERGVQPSVLPPGMYYNNPYVRRIDIIDTRSHTIDLSGHDAIHFPSNDSFDIVIDASVEYAIRQDRAPYVLAAIGDHTDIPEKLILPFMKSFCRIEGSKLLAREFIAGDTRTVFQTRVFEGLRERAYAQGIEIRATLIRRIEPPAEIANPISDRQVAGQQIKQYENEMHVAQSEARLVEQQEQQKQNQAIGQANRQVVSVVTNAKQSKEVALIEAQQRLEVAKLQLEAAKQSAEALVARGRAEAEVVRLTFEAEARPLRDAVAAFGEGRAYAQYFFYQRLAPAMKSVLATTDGPFADIFRSLGDAGAAAKTKRSTTGESGGREKVAQDAGGKP